MGEGSEKNATFQQGGSKKYISAFQEVQKFCERNSYSYYDITNAGPPGVNSSFASSWVISQGTDVGNDELNLLTDALISCSALHHTT